MSSHDICRFHREQTLANQRDIGIIIILIYVLVCVHSSPFVIGFVIGYITPLIYYIITTNNI